MRHFPLQRFQRPLTNIACTRRLNQLCAFSSERMQSLLAM